MFVSLHGAPFVLFVNDFRFLSKHVEICHRFSKKHLKINLTKSDGCAIINKSVDNRDYLAGVVQW